MRFRGNTLYISSPYHQQPLPYMHPTCSTNVIELRPSVWSLTKFHVQSTMLLTHAMPINCHASLIGAVLKQMLYLSKILLQFPQSPSAYVVPSMLLYRHKRHTHLLFSFSGENPDAYIMCYEPNSVYAL